MTLSQIFYDILKNKNTCYYHDVRKFRYWELTDENLSFFINHNQYEKCPFIGGMNQLWRNQLLALSIEHDSRQPYKQAYFSVVKHEKNMFLNKTIDDFKQLIDNNPKFSVFTSEDAINAASKINDGNLNKWVKWYKELYKL